MSSSILDEKDPNSGNIQLFVPRCNICGDFLYNDNVGGIHKQCLDSSVVCAYCGCCGDVTYINEPKQGRIGYWHNACANDHEQRLRQSVVYAANVLKETQP